ncbi:MAG TPA: helicase C-terminal domain-containing protein, partial [Chloroflexota bacterium]|nr:helicase C-terminal domain-containing protein [Chloroflexota bacterium]
MPRRTLGARPRLGTVIRPAGAAGAPLFQSAQRLDAWRLAALLVPGLGRGERAKLNRALGLELPPRQPFGAEGRLLEDEQITAACRTRLASLDVALLQQLARLFAGSYLPEARLIDEVFRERARTAFTETGGGQDGRQTEELLAPFSPSSGALQPAKTRRQVDAARVKAVLSPGGALATTLPGYEVRPGQVRMALAVSKALNERLHLLVEAGTGVGKSFAYLLPAVEYAVANGRRVVVSTNTINLQEQLYFKDIPLLRRALPTEFRAAVLKGRANYLCLRRWRAFLRDGLTTDADRMLAARILVWLRQTESGDRGELALDEHESIRWHTHLGADAQHCTPKTCKDNRAGRCFLSRARRRAEGAHVLVVNHALLLADQALESKVLPEYGDLVIDEAHHLEDAATKQLGAEIGQQELTFWLSALSLPQGPGRYAGLVSRLHTVLITAGGDALRTTAPELSQPAHDAVEAARGTLTEFFGAVMTFVRHVTDVPSGPMSGEREIRLTPGVRRGDAWEAVEEAWRAFGADLGDLDKALARVGQALDPFRDASELVDDALADLANARQELSEYRVNLSAIVTSIDPDMVSWLSVRDRGLTLHAAPLEVGPLLQQQLFAQKDCVVLTSATLQIGGSFRYARERIGLDDTTFTLAVPSPFDFPNQALLCIPGDLPDPTSKSFGEASLEALAEVCQVTRGRTLVLFTSHGALRAAHAFLGERLRGVVILGQGLDGPRQQLLERFKETPNAILLGTSSFWEGIDVVGEALTCLVIVKLPFAVPTDPVFAARSELLDDPFSSYAVPQAALRLKQGFG